MRMRKLLAICAMLVALAASADGADLRVLTAGAFKPVVQALVPLFERSSGEQVIVDNDTAGGLLRRIAGGEPFDLAVLPPAAVGVLAAEGWVATAGGQVLGSTGVGIVVAAGTPPPDIATTGALRQALLDAKSIAYIDPASGGSSGIFVASLLQRLGIADQVKAKTVLVPGGRVAEHVAAGEAVLGIHQISEIVPVQGVVLVGPLPGDVQSTTTYAAAVAAASRQSAAAQAFIALLAGPDGAAAMRQNGLTPEP
jgi:molybdate transport system substrate-binding protein